MSGTPTPESRSSGRTSAEKPPAAGGGNAPLELGQYRLLAPLGRGGMGQVFKALHLSLKREVAIKFVRGLSPESEASRRRFLHEMEALGRLDHVNIVRATDAGDWEGRPFLVMEALEGADLYKLVLTVGPLPIADACEIALQVACGLQYAHEKGLVHRDLKPSNLFLTRTGGVKILDLGLARIQDQLSESGLTPEGAVVGTLDYMAPEQASNPRAVDIRADLYSLGCTLYHLLAGFPPFHGPDYPSAAQKIFAHTQVAPPPLRESRPDVPDGVGEVVQRLLAKRPEERYDQPRDLEPPLRPFAAGADLARLVGQSRGHPPEALAGTESEIRVLTNAPAVAVAAPATPSAPPKPPPKRRWAARVIAFGALLLLGLVAAAVYLGWGRLFPTPAPAPDAAVDPNDLLTKPPVLLLHPTAATFDWKFRPEEHAFSFSTSDPCLFQLGESSSGDYGFEVALSRNAQADFRVGVFLGYRRGPEGDQPDVARYYAFTVRQLHPVLEHREGVAVELAPFALNFQNGNPQGYQALFSVQRDNPPLQDQRVRVRVEAGKIVQLVFGPYDLTDRVSPAALRPQDLSGAFGVCCGHGSGFIRGARLLPKNKEP